MEGDTIILSALCVALLSTAACEGKRSIANKRTTSTPTGSGQVLDGMQLDSARRVALETAKEAIAAGDPQRLRQLRKWVEGRASVPIFASEDLAALDLAIDCLERTPQAEAAVPEQSGSPKSKLSDAAQKACAAGVDE